MLEKLKKYYPPGYDCVKEWILIILWFIVCTILSFWLFVENLYQAKRSLYTYWYGERKLIEGAIVKPFVSLMEGYHIFFIPMFIFLLIMAVYHYIYYYQDTKSIYVMRRLSSKKYIIKSCIEGPLIVAVTGAAAILILCLLYFLIYILAIPSVCMPRFV